MIFNHKVNLTIAGPSDHSDGVSTHKFSFEKVYTERADCSHTDILLSEIKREFIISAML